MTQTTDRAPLHPEPSHPFGPAALPDPAGGGPDTPAGHRAHRGGDRSRRPGWFGVGAVAAGAAILSSLLTAGIVTSIDTGTISAAATPSATASPSAGGSVTSTGSVPVWTAVAAAVEPSVVTVTVQDGEGSGVVLDKAGHIVTNYHVVAGAAGGTITVTLSDGRAYRATVVGTDPTTDLAVVKLSTVPSDLTPATLGTSATVKVGDAVMAIGNPLGLSDTVTTGIVSALDRPVSTSSESGGTSGTQVVTNAIQTDAAVNPGNSGGALVDGQGRVIGITSSIASLSSNGSGQSGSIGLGFAIPIDQAKDVAQQLIATGKATHAYLGVRLGDGTITVDGAQRAAAVVGQVTAGTPAQSAGLAAGDAIVAVDGRSINGADNLIGTVRALKPGTTVSLTVVRAGNARTVSLSVGTAPATAN
jgi:putative serine protease PepD